MQFYIMQNKRFNDVDYAYGEQIDLRTGDFDKCEFCGLPISMRKWLQPRKVKLSKPSFGDFVYGTFPAFLVSERFREEYNRSGLNGILNFDEVEVVKVNNKRFDLLNPPQYYHVTIVRSKSLIDEELSKLVRDGEPECNVCRTGGILQSLDGIFLLPGTWGGEDIFYANGLSGIIITSNRFREFVLSNKFTNVNLLPSEDYKMNFQTVQHML